MSRSTESTATKLIARVKHSADEEWTMGGSVASSAGTLHTEKTLASYVKVTDGVRKVQLKSSFTQSGFRPQVFSFNRCFSQETTQAAFFAECGAIHSINCLLDTCGNLDMPSTEVGNFCMIAYGQTGAGKTHTMFGSCPSTGQPLNHSHIDAAVEENYETETQEEDPRSQPGDGLIVRSIEYLFIQLLHSVAAVPNFHLKLSCIEIYEDLVYDLFSGSNTLPVHLHEDVNEGFSVQGCQLIDCTSFESAAAAIELIARHRRGRYAPNSRTSPLKDKEIHPSVHKVDRSHCIIEISVCVPMVVGEGAMSVYNSGLVTPASQAALLRENEYITDAVNSPRFVTRAKMTFVDLAGSERLLPDPKVDHKPTAGSTKSANKSLTSNLFGTKEVGVINPSLYVLGRVIAGLVRTHNSTHTSEVPFQDSVLTKLLIAPLARGNFLGANILIACIDDSPRCEYETLRTLKFATSCVQLRNSPDIATPKASKEDRAISELKLSIKKVKEENQELRRTILATPSWGDKILAHCDEDTLEASSAFANAPPRMKPKIKDVKKPVSLSEKKRTWADWKLFETASAAKNKTKKTPFLPLPSHAASVGSGCRVYPLAGPVLNGSPTSLSRSSQMSHSLTQGSLQDTQQGDKSMQRGSSAPSPSKQHLHEPSMDGEIAREEMRLMELGDGLKHSGDSNDPVYATDGQRIRPKTSPTERTSFQMGAATMSAFPDSEEDQHDAARRKLFSKTGPVPARHRATDYFEPVLDGKRGRGPEKTAKDQNHMAEVRMAAQLKKRVLDECKKKNHMPISPYLAHFVPKRVIRDRPTFEVPLLHDIVPLHASIHQDSPDSDGSHGPHERTAQAHHHSQSGSPEHSNSSVAKMNISGTLHTHSPPRSRPHSRHTKRTQSARRSPGSAGRRSPQGGSQSPGKPRSPEVQKLQKLIRTPTMMFELLDAEYQNYPYDEEMYVNRKPLQERIAASDKPRAVHGPPVITQMVETDEFSPDTGLDLSVDGTSLSPAQKKELKEDPQPDDEGEYDAYDEEFEAEESSIPAQEASADEVLTKVSSGTVASHVNAETAPVTFKKIEHPVGKTSPSVSRTSPTTIPSAPTSAGKSREVPLFPIAGAANAPVAPRSPINLSMKMLAPASSMPSPTQSQKMFSQPTSRAESPVATSRNWEAEADLLMAPMMAANQERVEQENQIHFLHTFSPPRDTRTTTDSELGASIAMREEGAEEEDYDEEFDEEEENAEKKASDSVKHEVELKEQATPASAAEPEPHSEAERLVDPAVDNLEITADADADAVNNAETEPTKAPLSEGVTITVSEGPAAVEEPTPSQDPDEEDYGEEFEEEEEAPMEKEDHVVTVEQDDLAMTGPASEAPLAEVQAADSELSAEPTAEADTYSKTVEPVVSNEETDAPVSDISPAEESITEQNHVSDEKAVEPLVTQETVEPVFSATAKSVEQPNEVPVVEPSEPVEVTSPSEEGEKEADYEKDYEMEFTEEEEDGQVLAAPVVAVEQEVVSTVDEIVAPVEAEESGAVETELLLDVASKGAATATEGHTIESDSQLAEAGSSVDVIAVASAPLPETTEAQATDEAVSDSAPVASVEAVVEPVDAIETVAATEIIEPAATELTVPVSDAVENEEENYDEEFEADDNEPEANEKMEIPANTAEETSEAVPADGANEVVSNAAAVVEQDIAEPSEHERESEAVAERPVDSDKPVFIVDKQDVNFAEADYAHTSEEIVTDEEASAVKANQVSAPVPAENVLYTSEAASLKSSVTHTPTKPPNFEAFSAKLSGDAVQRAVSRLESSPPKPAAPSSPLEIELQDDELTLSPMRRSAGETVLSQMSPISPVRVLGDIDPHHFISATTFNSNTTTSEVFAHLQHEEVSEFEELSAEYSPDATLHGIAENDLTNASAASLLALAPPVEASPSDQVANISEEVITADDEQRQEETASGVMERERFPVGTRVEANYRGKGRWYTGVISRVRSKAGTVDIDYDDGEKETHVEKELVRAGVAGEIAPSLESFKFGGVAGDSAAAVVAAEVEPVLPDVVVVVDGAVFVESSALTVEPINSIQAVLDAPTEISVIESTNLTVENLSSSSFNVDVESTQRAEHEKDETAVNTSALPAFPVGTRVEANYRGKGRWYAGVISRVRSSAGTVDIDYDDGEKETHVEQELVRTERVTGGVLLQSDSPNEGEIVADVVAAAPESAVVEGESELVEAPITPIDKVVEASSEEQIIESVPPVEAESREATQGADHEINNPVVAAPDLTSLSVGTRVEANYRGKGRWYAGVISRVRSNAATVDIDYDDGEKETHVEQDLVRLEKVSVVPPAASATAGAMEAPASEPPLLEESSGPLVTAVTEAPEADIAESAQEVTEDIVAAPVAVIPENVAFPVGTRVEGNYRGSGHWYPGVVSVVNVDGSVDIDYDDGEKETNMDASLVRAKSPALAVGTRIEANYRGLGTWYPGCVSQVHEDNFVDVDYDDGEKETRVGVALVRLEDSTAAALTSASADPDAESKPSNATEATLPVGTRVEGNYRGSGHWYPGVVSAVHRDGSVDLDYDDGEKETGVVASLVRPEVATAAVSGAAPAVGTRIEANYRGLGTWYPGSVAHVNADGSADIDYDDGEKETQVAVSMIRLTVAPILAALPVGTRVEGNYRGFGRWYPGVVSAVNADGSVDLDYDDGEKESSVAAVLVRLLEAPSSEAIAAEAEAEVVASIPVAGASSDVTNDPTVGSLSVGTRIEANYRSSGHWYPGCVSQVNADGTVDINYDDGEQESNVAASLVRLEGPAVITPVVASEEESAETEAVVSEPASSVIEVGLRVEGNYRGKGEWLTGEVLRLHGGGMADVNYDHGEVEGFVPPAWLRLVASVEPAVEGAVEEAADTGETADLHATTDDNEVDAQETVAFEPTAELAADATDLDILEGAGPMSASGEEDEEKEFIPNFEDFWKELPSKSGEEPTAAAANSMAAAVEPEFVASGDVQDNFASEEDEEAEGEVVPNVEDLLAEVPDVSEEEPMQVSAADDIEAAGEKPTQVQYEPLGHSEEDPLLGATPQEFDSTDEFVPSFKNFWSEDLAEKEVAASVEVPATQAEIEVAAEMKLPKDVQIEAVLNSEAVEDSAKEAVMEEAVSEIAPADNAAVEIPEQEILTQSAVDKAETDEVFTPLVEELRSDEPDQVEPPAVAVEAMPDGVTVPDETEKMSAESAAVEVAVEVNDFAPTESTLEETAHTAPSVPTAEPEMQLAEVEPAELLEEQPVVSAVNEEVVEVTTHDSAEPAAETTAVEVSAAEDNGAPELSAKEVENANLSVPPAEQETNPVLSQQSETPSSEPNLPVQPEEPAAVSPVSVEDVPADDHNNNTSDSKKLTPQASESMFDVDFSELASAKETPTNHSNEKNDKSHENNKSDSAMDSATLAALALNSDSTDDQQQEQEQYKEQEQDKESPKTILNDVVDNKTADAAPQDSVSDKPTAAEKSEKSEKSGKSKKSVGGEEEEEDLYDVDF